MDYIKNAEIKRDSDLFEKVVQERIKNSNYLDSSTQMEPIIQIKKHQEETDEFCFIAGLSLGFDTYLDDQEDFGYIEDALGLSRLDFYNSQCIESESSIYLDEDDSKENKRRFKLVSDILGTYLSTDDKPKFDKVETKDCVKYLSSFTGNKKHKRTAKYNFGNIVVREFDNHYQILEYNGCLIMVSVLF